MLPEHIRNALLRVDLFIELPDEAPYLVARRGTEFATNNLFSAEFENAHAYEL